MASVPLHAATWRTAPRADLIAGIRHRVVSRASRWGLGLTDEAEDALRLLVSELVSNAVTHTHGDVLTLSLAGYVRELFFEVTDDDTSGPIVLPAGGDREHGRGMYLVSALASSWGFHPTPHGKCVWFTLTLPAPRPAPSNPTAPGRAAGTMKQRSVGRRDHL